VVVQREVFGSRVSFLIEAPRADSFHPCTIDDIVAVLELLPRQHTIQIPTLVLRQPKRKEEALASCWGRLVYWSDLGRYEGPTIYLESQPREKRFRWPLSQDPLGLEELDRLRRDGHGIVRTSRSFEISSTPEACRTTQLFRTLPHELGHYVHYLEALDSGIDHWSRPSREKEQFAHAYATSFQEEYALSGRIPFPRKMHLQKMRQESLDPAWFAP